MGKGTHIRLTYAPGPGWAMRLKWARTGACHLCGGTRFWKGHNNAGMLCARCHPPLPPQKEKAQ